MKQQLRNYVTCALLALPAAATLVALPVTAFAQPAPEVRSLAVEADGPGEPGTMLTFTLEGTPRSQATVRIRELRANIALRETRRGVYVGSYTLKRGEQLDATAGVRASLESGNRRATANYELAELLPQQTAPVVVAPPRVADPRIERFGMGPIERIEPGEDLRFALEGTPGGIASVDLPGVRNDVALREVRPGFYEGGYTLRRSDDFNPNRPIVATLRNGDRVVSANLNPAGNRPGAGADFRPNGDNRPDSNPRSPYGDNRAPTLTFLDPPDGATVPAGLSGHFAATFEDFGGSGVVPRSVRVLLSGRDVTQQVVITSESISYWGPIPPGRHTVEVTGRDAAGNELRKSWNFNAFTPVR